MILAVILHYVLKIRIATSEEAVRNLKKIAIPAIALVAFSMIKSVHAITYVECVDACDQHEDAHPLAKLLCYAMCAIFTKS